MVVNLLTGEATIICSRIIDPQSLTF